VAVLALLAVPGWEPHNGRTEAERDHVYPAFGGPWRDQPKI